MNDPKLIEKIIRYLKLEFGWFLELNKKLNKKIFINGEELTYDDLVGEDSEEFIISPEDSNKSFNVKYIRWKEKPTEEYSKFYYLDEKHKEKYKENTTLNNQGDQFYHSVYISSNYFKDFNFNSSEDTKQKALNGGVKSDELFKKLLSDLYSFLRKKRKPFLKQHSNTVIEELRQENVIPSKNQTDFEIIQTQELEATIKGIYEIEPKIFSNLRIEQKKTLIGMLNILLHSEERGKILDIIDHIIKLDPQERTELDELLKVTKLSCIVKTMNLIKQRYEVLEILKKINYEGDFGANEVNHLQKVIEANTWIFGEQYNLISSAEDTFDKALKEFRKKIDDEEIKDKMTNPERNKQMDIFLCRQTKKDSKIHNIILELKHPKKRIGEKEVSQIKNYFRIILKEPRFNASSYTWDYILIGSRFDDSGYIEGEQKNTQRYGEEGLIFNPESNHKIYAKKWSDILIDCELRHEFLNKKFEIQKDQLIKDIKTPEDAVKKSIEGSSLGI
jgi:hypothetical protein